MIRLGMLGAGPMGSGNARAFAKLSGRCVIAAVADLNQEAAARLAEPYKATVVQDFHDMFGAVDAVVISTPNFLHPDQAVACASAGRHVFIEKPMALSVADADRIVAAVDAAKVASFVGFSVRFDAVPHAMRERFRTGELGALRSIWSRRIGFWIASAADSSPAKPRASWRSSVEHSGGVLHELMAHEIDWEMSIGGIPTSVYCRKMSRDHDNPRANDHVWITIGFGPEVSGTIEGAQAGAVDDYYRGFMAEKGSMYTEKWGGDLYLQVKKSDREKLDQLVPFNKYANFLDAIEGKAKSVADVHWGREVVKVTEMALQSAMTGEVARP
jgi:predicted dehydrogenase